MEKVVEVWSTLSTRTDWVNKNRTVEQLKAAANEWNNLAINGQKITFVDANQLPKSSNPTELLGGVYWTGFLTSRDGQIFRFERLCSKEIKAKAEKVGMTWKRKEYTRQQRMEYLKGVYGRTDIDREKASKVAFEHLKEYLAADEVASLVKLDEETMMIEITSALYSADMDAKPPSRKEINAQLEKTKELFIEALCNKGWSREDAIKVLNSEILNNVNNQQ